jgi:hypothetical protein
MGMPCGARPIWAGTSWSGFWIGSPDTRCPATTVRISFLDPHACYAGVTWLMSRRLYATGIGVATWCRRCASVVSACAARGSRERCPRLSGPNERDDFFSKNSAAWPRILVQVSEAVVLVLVVLRRPRSPSTRWAHDHRCADVLMGDDRTRPVAHASEEHAEQVERWRLSRHDLPDRLDRPGCEDVVVVHEGDPVSRRLSHSRVP